MALREPIALQPSRLAAVLLRVGFPAAMALLALAAWQARDPWPLGMLPVMACLAAVAAGSWDRVRGIDLRARGLFLELGDGCWHRVRPLGSARVSVLAITLPCMLVEQRRRVRLNIWRDALDEADFRRLARIARHDRWPAQSRRQRSMESAS